MSDTTTAQEPLAELQETTVDTAEKLGLLPEEFADIKKILGRTPNFTELAVFSAMWSEHCSYKNSIRLLKTLPRSGKRTLVEAGEENAGLIDIGSGWACAFKIESHNHPSAIEPYQGAATGVGGINRDIFTMGARPIAQLNSLRFGDPNSEHTQWLVRGVVKGIGDYGNSFGVPVLGGEVYFDECYNTNPLVNAMSVGVLRAEKMISATSYGDGNPVFIVGSSTGKDGILGASFASKDITDSSMDDLPAVQVGDPFMEKLLLEATLELAETDAIIGMQDMGAAGITCSTCEMSAKGEHGMLIHLHKVPTRQENMLPWEILLSESQERMLVVVKKGREQEVMDIFDKWDLHCEEIGTVTKDRNIKYYWHDQLVADVPADSLVLGGGAPVYTRESQEPEYYERFKKFDINSIPEPEGFKEIGFKLLGLPNIASKRWVYQQYDSMVRTNNMSTNAPSDAGIIAVKEAEKALAVSVDCNSRYVNADPQIGAMIAVSECARNIACSGGVPAGVTNCLNFGNPYDPAVYWQFENVIKGMGKACERFDAPVTGGNVSFYNQTVKENSSDPVYPTPTIGMVGVIDDPTKTMSMNFKEKGDLIYVLGERVEDIGSSEYLVNICGVRESPVPYFHLEKEHSLHNGVHAVIKEGLINAAHDVSEGGLWVTLVEMGFENRLGFDVLTDSDMRPDAFMFGEGQGRIVVTCPRGEEEPMLEVLEPFGIDALLLGHVTKGKLVVDDEQCGVIEDAQKIYEEAIPQLMEN